MLQYIHPYTVTETICFLLALFLLIKDPDFSWRMLIWFLLITCIVEIGTIPMQKIYRDNPIPQNSNAWVFNILLLFQVGFFSLMFEHLLGKYINGKPIIFSGLAVFLITYLYNLFFHNLNGIFDYNSIADSVMGVLFVLYSLYYYYLLLRDDDYVDLKYSASFWWVTGTLFFYFGSTACDFFYEILKSEPFANKLYLAYINNTLIIVLYACWSYSFICRKWLTTTSKA